MNGTLPTGPVQKVAIELLDTQVFSGSVQEVLLEISWNVGKYTTIIHGSVMGVGSFAKTKTRLDIQASLGVLVLMFDRHVFWELPVTAVTGCPGLKNVR